MRYINAKTTKLIHDLTDGLKENSVDWMPNYTNKKLEPITLPVKYPLSLINGGFGIGQGYICSVPPHNFEEVCNMAIKIIKNPSISLDEVANEMIPDFPTGGIIINRSDLPKIYKEGYGTMYIRGRVEKDYESNTLTITEIPYMSNLKDIKDGIQKAIIDNLILNVVDIKDATNKANGVSLAIRIKKSASLDELEDSLYKYTKLKTDYTVSLVCSERKSFNTYNIKEMFTKWIEYRRDTLIRIFTHRLSSKYKRQYIIEGLLKVLKDLDGLFTTIKSSKDKKDLENKLIKKYDLIEIQATKIAETEAYKFTKMNVNALKDELKLIKSESNNLLNTISTPSEINKVMIQDLKDGIKNYKRERRTMAEDIVAQEKIILDEEYQFFITNTNKIKKLEMSVKSIGKPYGILEDGEYITNTFTMNNTKKLMLFTNKGQVHYVNASDIELSSNKGEWVDLSSLIVLNKGEKIVGALRLFDRKEEQDTIITITRKGYIKRMKMSEFQDKRIKSMLFTKLYEKDEVIQVGYSQSDEDTILISTTAGIATKYKMTELNPILRPTFGVKAIIMEDPNVEIVGFIRIFNDRDISLCVISSDSRAKIINSKEIPVTSRSTKGRIITKLATEKDTLVKVIEIMEDTKVVVHTNLRMATFKEESISKVLRTSMGRPLFTMKSKEVIKDAHIEE